MQKFQASLAELLESVAQLKVEVFSLSRTQTKGNENNEVDGTQRAADLTAASATRSSTTVSTRHDSPGSSDIRSVVHRTLRDITRRKCNVVVSGLPEPQPSCHEEDAKTFAKICEEHLCCKPLILKCVRLGKQLPDKPRRLLVHLRSENVAAELLTAARHLRNADDPVIAQQVYVNEDLTPEAAKLASEAREQRRRQRNQQNTMTTEQPISSRPPTGAMVTGATSSTASTVLSATASPLQPTDIPVYDTASLNVEASPFVPNEGGSLDP